MHANRLTRLLLFFLAFFVLIFLNTDSFASTIRQHDGIPAVLVNKYWKFTPKEHNASEYFYANRSTFIAKHTLRGTFYSKNISYEHINGFYILQGTDSKSPQNMVWWFIRPIKKWSTIKLGYTSLPLHSIPNHSPKYYARNTAVRTSEVTAILH